ncbi:MAG: hypothetical protein RIF32_14805 [Leptospirales bacterium]|jgi:hypothetical protein
MKPPGGHTHGRRPPAPLAGFAFVSILLMSLPACRLLFSQAGERWLDSGWLNYTTVVEVQMRFDTRRSWNPLNQDSISSAYESRIYLRPVRDAATGAALSEAHARPLLLARYPGWTLNGSVYGLSDCVLAIRGGRVSVDQPGGPDREVFCWPLRTSPGAALSAATLPDEAARESEEADESEAASVAVLQPAAGETLLAAIPAPNQLDLLAVFLTRSTLEDRREELLVDVYQFGDGQGFRKLSRRKIPWRGDPGMPDVAWATNGARIYIKRYDDVVETTGDLRTPASAAALHAEAPDHKIARDFPRCFHPTDSGAPVSADGILYVPEPAGSARGYEGGSPVPDQSAAQPETRKTRGFRLEPMPTWRGFARVDLITDFRRIGYGCR